MRRDDFPGLDVEEMGSRARVAAALSVLVPVVLSGVILVVFAPGLWWIFTIYGWVVFPAFGLLVSGASGLGGSRSPEDREETEERELLRALREHGELTPALAAMETSLSVDGADRRLRELAEQGHLEMRVRGGALAYAPWGTGGERET